MLIRIIKTVIGIALATSMAYTEPVVYMEQATPVRMEEPYERFADTYTVIENMCDATVNFVGEVNYNYGKLPEFTRNIVESGNWKIKIETLDNIRGILGSSSAMVLGITDTENKTIYIANRVGASETSVIHECFHVLDKNYNWISETNEFWQIYEAEKTAFCNFHSTHKNNVSSVKEYFGEAGQMYVLDSDGLKEVCPKTWDYIDKWATGRIFKD